MTHLLLLQKCQTHKTEPREAIRTRRARLRHYSVESHRAAQQNLNIACFIRLIIFNGPSKYIDIAMISPTEASPIGSEIFAAISLLVICAVVLLLLRHYLPLRTTPAYLLVPIFFALFLPASIVLLVPIDLASSAREQDAGSRGIWLPESLLLVSWRICYVSIESFYGYPVNRSRVSQVMRM